jgi:tetratricopeptide (TPR) repeat protein
MRSPIALLRFIAKAVINAAAGGLPIGDFLVDVVPEIGRDAWDAWAGSRTEAERRAEIEAVVLIPDSEAPMLAAQIAGEVATGLSEEVRQLVIGYLTMVPAAARASLRRRSDPSGTTVPPDLVPRSGDELIRFLPTRLPRFKPGDRPSGLDWELERFLGVGGFGEVWKARHLYQRSRPPAAIKFCNDAKAARLLRNEVDLLDALMSVGLHPSIVRLLDTHLGSEPYCLIYECVEGGDLTGLIQSWHRQGSGPTPSQVADLVRQIAEVIGTAHRLDPPIVHRDLKPSNILVAQAANGLPQIKITDFGIGGLAARQAVQLSQRGASQGQFLVSVVRGSFTPLYASPQQTRGADPDPRDDVFALGVIWFQLMTGRLDEGRPGGRRWPDRLKGRGMSPELIDLLASCFEDEREDRPANAQALADAIAALLTPPIPVPPTPPEVPEDRVPPDDEPKTAADYINRGNVRHNRKDYVTAIADYDQAIRLDPNYAIAYNNRGNSRKARGDLDGAVSDYDQAIRLDPKFASPYMGRGIVHHDRKDYAAAIADYDQAIRLDPKYESAYINRGNSRKAKGDLDGAVSDYDQAIRLDPKYASAYNGRGIIRYDRKDYAAAIADYDQAIRLDPNFAVAYIGRGNVHHDRKDYAAAIVDYDQVIRLDPNYTLAYNNRGNSRRAKGDLDGAVSDYDQAIRLDPKYALAYNGRGSIRHDRKDYAAAIADYDQAIRLDPKYASAYYNRGLARQAKGDLDGALDDFSEAARLAPDNLDYLEQIDAIRRRKK